MTTGYIVLDKVAGPQHESERDESRGVLFAGAPVTIFPCRDKARTAIRRTVRWARSLPGRTRWRETDYQIMRVVPAIPIASAAALTLAERERKTVRA
jgi:hypothetical protein